MALTGPSGSGKTSLGMLLAGLENPDSGRLIIGGVQPALMKPAQKAEWRRLHVGIVFQHFHLVPALTALENAAIPLELAGDVAAHDKASRLLCQLGLGKRLQHFPAQLSGGEQQRVAMARALASTPQLIIADEPTGNLDSKTAQQVMDLLFSLVKEHNITLLLITHDMQLAAHCNRQLRLDSGQLVP